MERKRVFFKCLTASVCVCACVHACVCVCVCMCLCVYLCVCISVLLGSSPWQRNTHSDWSDAGPAPSGHCRGKMLIMGSLFHVREI